MGGRPPGRERLDGRSSSLQSIRQKESRQGARFWTRRWIEVSTLPGRAQKRIVAVIGTLDTKAEEVAYIQWLVNRQDCEAVVIDPGILGEPGMKADVTREQIAGRAGTSMDEVRRLPRREAVETMAAGLKGILQDMYEAGRLHAAIGIGGATNCAIISPGLGALPIGVPKVLASPVASGDTRIYVGTSDMILVHSVTDIMGLNRVSRRIFQAAVGAAIGPLGISQADAEDYTKKAVAITAFGVTTPAAMRCRELLKTLGHDVLVFSASGIGGMAMERLIAEGLIDGVIDLTTTELADELVGGVLSAGPHRLEAAGNRGIPQVVVPGAMDMVNFGPRPSVPSRFEGRLFYQHTPAVTLMRTTVEENKRLGAMMAEKLNRATGPVRVVIPRKGFSAYDSPGKPFFDPEADAAFVEGLKGTLSSKVAVIECDLHINDPAFAQRLVEEFVTVSCWE